MPELTLTLTNEDGEVLDSTTLTRDELLCAKAEGLHARALLDRLNPGSGERTEWNTAQLQRDFEVLGFQAPYCVVRRKSDGQKGSLQFDHSPRRYYDFTPHCTD